MNNTLVNLKGTSALGKGTRVNQFLTFLKDFKKLPFEEKFYSFTKENGKQKTIKTGLYFPDLKMFFLGEYKISNKSGLESWSSLDIYNGTFGAEGCSNFLKELINSFSDTIIIFEGYPLTMSFRYRPAYFFEEFGIKKLYTQYFVYDNEELFKKRVYNRSGSFPKETSKTWDSNARFDSEYNFICNDGKLNSSYEDEVFLKYGVSKYSEFKNKFDIYDISKYNQDAPVTVLGVLVAYKVLKDENLTKEFLEFSTKTNVLRSIENPI